MKKFTLVLLSLIILLSNVIFVSAKAVKDPPANKVVQATRDPNAIIPMVNDDVNPWYAGGTSSGWYNTSTNPPTYTAAAQSRARTAYDGGEIRDIDYIYARCRAYVDQGGGNIMYMGSSSDTQTNAADALAMYTEQVTFCITYGTHTFKEAGYNDITLETSYTY